MKILRSIKHLENDSEKIKEALRNEETHLTELREDMQNQLGTLNTSILQHAEYFEKRSYTKTQVQSLLSVIGDTRLLFKQVAKEAQKIHENQAMQMFSAYCSQIADGLDKLYEIVEQNKIVFQGSHERTILNSDDVIDELRKIMSEAWTSLDRNLREKYAVDVEFERKRAA